MKIFNFSCFFSLLLCLMASCAGNNSSTIHESGVEIIKSASLLSIKDCDNYSVATIRNPWDTTKILAKYILVNQDTSTDSLPEGTIVNVPVNSSLVYSGVYGGIISELGAADAVTGVADGDYFRDSTIVAGLKSGHIINVGNSMSPSIELIVEMKPDVILTSPYQNSGHGAIETLNTPIIEMADYMELTPLGRAEWIKLIGRIYGKAAKADSIYRQVCDAYTSLVSTVSGDKPMVITEQPIEGTWAMPGGNSYMARLLHDAGGNYPWADNTSAGSIQLDPAAVLEKAENADIWLIKSYGALTLDNLKSNNQLCSRFKAFSKGGVYVCDTSVSALFDEFPFHPERLLSDYIAIMHPETATSQLRYFKKL